MKKSDLIKRLEQIEGDPLVVLDGVICSRKGPMHEWREATAVVDTGVHQDAITIIAHHPQLGGGVIIVPPDKEVDSCA